MSVDEKLVAQSHIQCTGFCFSLNEAFDVVADTGSPVIEDYDTQMPFKFTRILARLTIELCTSVRTCECLSLVVPFPEKAGEWAVSELCQNTRF